MILNGETHATFVLGASLRATWPTRDSAISDQVSVRSGICVVDVPGVLPRTTGSA